MRLYAFSELAEIIQKNETVDDAYCHRVTGRFIQNNFRSARGNQDAIDSIFIEPEVWPQSLEWCIYLQGVAEILINFGLKPSYEVTWITDETLKACWSPVAETETEFKRYGRSTPPEMRKRNIIVGDGIIKAV